MRDCNMSKMPMQMEMDEKSMDMKQDSMEMKPMYHMNPMCHPIHTPYMHSMMKDMDSMNPMHQMGMMGMYPMMGMHHMMPMENMHMKG